MIAFPDTRILPCPTIETSGSNDPRIVRTEMDSGLIRQRLRFKSRRFFYSVSWIFDYQQLSLFRLFVSDIIDDGSLEFTMSMPTGNSFDSRMVDQVCRIVGGTYEMSNVSKTYWSVTADIEILSLVDSSSLVEIFRLNYSEDPNTFIVFEEKLTAHIESGAYTTI